VIVVLLGEARGSHAGAWRRAALVGAVLVVVAHLLHGAIGLPVRIEAAATDALALGLGAWVAARWTARASADRIHSARTGMLPLAYAALLVLWGWRPFVPETSVSAMAAQFTPVRFVPLASLSARVDVFSAVHVVQQFLLYLPLGALMTAVPTRSARGATLLAAGAALAFGIELGHVVVAGRYFDVTNALIACAGLGMGWAVMRRAGFERGGAVAPPPR
jgi:hypothetical protein